MDKQRKEPAAGTKGARVLEYIRANGPVSFQDIQKFVCQMNGRDYEQRDARGRRVNRGYWCDYLTRTAFYGGKNGLLVQFCTSTPNGWVVNPKPIDLETAVDLYWQDVQEGLDDDLRDDSETFDLTTDSYRAGWLAALKFVKENS